MARGPEGKIQDKVLKYAKSRGVLYKKNEVGRYFVSSGWPDVIFFPGKSKCFFMEFKAPNKDLTPLQAHKKKELEEAEYSHYVVDNVEAGKRIIDYYGKR